MFKKQEKEEQNPENLKLENQQETKIKGNLFITYQ